MANKTVEITQSREGPSTSYEPGSIATIVDTEADALIAANAALLVPSVTGARNSGEGALASLLTVLATAGIIVDETTAS